METHVAVSAARYKLSELIKRSIAGEHIVLNVHGVPAAALVPLTGPGLATELRCDRCLSLTGTHHHRAGKLVCAHCADVIDSESIT